MKQVVILLEVFVILISDLVIDFEHMGFKSLWIKGIVGKLLLQNFEAYRVQKQVLTSGGLVEKEEVINVLFQGFYFLVVFQRLLLVMATFLLFEIQNFLLITLILLLVQLVRVLIDFLVAMLDCFNYIGYLFVLL